MIIIYKSSDNIIINIMIIYNRIEFIYGLINKEGKLSIDRTTLGRRDASFFFLEKTRFPSKFKIYRKELKPDNHGFLTGLKRNRTLNRQENMDEYNHFLLPVILPRIQVS